jgi:Cdc25 family phosphatase
MKIPRITVVTLLEWFTSNSPKLRETLILDVREDDYVFGKIPGSVNIPFCIFTESLPNVMELLKGKRYAIVHCHFSQSRGPAAAEILAKSLDGVDDLIDVEVLVLEGGWKTWRLICASDHPQMIEPIEPNHQKHKHVDL